eukprot:5753084-Amphidinium_carterae.1
MSGTTADEGPLACIKLGYSSSAIYINKWRVAYVTSDDVQVHFDKSWPTGVPRDGLAMESSGTRGG